MTKTTRSLKNMDNLTTGGAKRPSVALIDADLWCYDIPFAAQSNKDQPSKYFDYCLDYAETRLEHILDATGCTSYEMYLTGDKNFRHDISTVLVYKGNRKSPRPWHYENMRLYLEYKHKAEVINGLEADDQLAIRSIALGDSACIVSRDKDLRMVPGWHYGYAVGNQPESPLEYISELGYLTLNKNNLKGGGLKFFYAQMVMGDSTDNIQGLPKGGPVLAFKTLNELQTEAQMYEAVLNLYTHKLGEEEGYRRLIEMGRLLWMVQKYDNKGEPEMWNPPVTLDETV